MQRKAESGVMPGCTPVGYVNVKRGNELVIELDFFKRQLATYLFELAAQGYSIRKAGRMAELKSKNGKELAHDRLGDRPWLAKFSKAARSSTAARIVAEPCGRFPSSAGWPVPCQLSRISAIISASFNSNSMGVQRFMTGCLKLSRY
jgi:hypothetical protein